MSCPPTKGEVVGEVYFMYVLVITFKPSNRDRKVWWSKKAVFLLASLSGIS